MTSANRRRAGGEIGLGLLCATFLALGISVGVRTNWFPVLNDFWPLLFQANTLDLGDLETFKNGFFPPGYAIFLNLIGGEGVLARAFLANLFFTAATTMVTYGLVRLFGSPLAAFVAAALVLAHPLVFSLALTTGPDAGSVFLLTGGFFLLAAGAQVASTKTRHAAWLLAGLLFGVAALWRYHALVFAVAAVISALLAYREWGTLRAGGGRSLPFWCLVRCRSSPGSRRSWPAPRPSAFGRRSTRSIGITCRPTSPRPSSP